MYDLANKSDVQVTEVMTHQPLVVDMDTTVMEIKEIFDSTRFHHLLVVDDCSLAGVISDRDVLKVLSPYLHTLSEKQRDIDLLKRKSHQIMTHGPVTISVDTTVKQAVQALLKEGISCLPVVNAQGGIEGIVTWRDLLQYLAGTVADDGQ